LSVSWKCENCRTPIAISDPLQNEIVQLLGDDGASGELVSTDAHGFEPDSFKVGCEKCGATYWLRVKPARKKRR